MEFSKHDLLEIEGYLITLRDGYQRKAMDGGKLEHLTTEQAATLTREAAAEAANITRLLHICDAAIEGGAT